MRSSALIILFLLTGCGSTLTGQWEGICTVLVGAKPVDYDIELNVTQVADGDVDGDGEVVDIDAQNILREGDLDGTQDGKDVTFEIDLPEGAFGFEGELSGASISGSCEWQAQKGDFELDKVEG
jgi:hypothetical protein